MTRVFARKALAAAGVVLLVATAAACGSGRGGSRRWRRRRGQGRLPDARHRAPPATSCTTGRASRRSSRSCAQTARPLYNNADGSADKQQQQFNSALAQGAKVIVLDPVDSAAAVSLVNAAHAKGAKVIAYDRPIPDAKVDFYVSFDNEEIGKEIATSLDREGQVQQGAAPVPGS